MYEKIIRYLLSGSIMAFFISCQERDNDTITKQEAIEIINQYTHVLAKGDSSGILPFWSSRSSAKPGFWYMHAYVGGRLELSQWPDFLTSFSPQVQDVRTSGNHSIIDLMWVERDSSATHERRSVEMRYYVTQEKKRWVFINPIDVLTQDWESYESDHFIYHFPEEIRIADHMNEIRASDESFERMLRFFEIEIAERIHFYTPRTAQECGELILHPSANGYAPLPPKSWLKHPVASYKIISPSFYHPHEVAHSLTALAGIVCSNHIVLEGFAVALGGVTATTEDLTLVESRNLLEASMLIPLAELFSMPNNEYFRKNYITYYESGALIRFLHERFGMERLRVFCSKTEDSDNLGEILKGVYDMSVRSLEHQFHEYLLNTETPDIGYDIPPGVTPVFSMEDPENDDTGDGDYVYPQHPNFEDGVFDLRHFAVFKNKENAFFRITMSKLMMPASYREGGDLFIPCIVIAIHKGKEEGMPQNRDCHGVQFAPDEGYHIKLNIGTAISFSNYLGKVYFTTPDIVYEFIDKKQNSIDFSVPLDMIGEPEADWKYFVGVGLTTNRIMNFIHGGPTFVRQDHRAFISGGNYAQGNPDFIDILLAPSIDQEKVLSRYDVSENIKPIVAMVGVSE
jgi:hypothetical protein